MLIYCRTGAWFHGRLLEHLDPRPCGTNSVRDVVSCGGFQTTVAKQSRALGTWLLVLLAADFLFDLTFEVCAVEATLGGSATDGDTWRPIGKSKPHRAH